ncbi:MAG: ABC transporter permease [Alistipes sp.]|nr:ABC transporter permease [Alistipes sp.]
MNIDRGLLWLKISRRYMFSPKSHSVINIISMVSVIAVAIPTAAMIILLAMFGGISQTIDTLYKSVDADIEILASRGQTFDAEAISIEELLSTKGIKHCAPYLEQSIVATTAQHRTTLTLRGIDSSYHSVLPVSDFVYRGSVNNLSAGKIVLGTAAAYTLGAQSVGHPVELYALNRRQLSSLLPTSGFSRKKAEVAAVVSINAEIDAELALAELGFTQSLLNYPGRISSIAIKLDDGYTPEAVQQSLREMLGEEFIVRTRNEKNASMNALIRLERFAIILIGSFIAIVAAFSIVGAVIMLITEKRRDITTLRSMGGNQRLIRNIFVGEGMLLTLLGCLIGLGIGIGFTLGQEYFGWVKIPGNMIFESYPVELTMGDVVMVAMVVMVAGWIISRLTVGAKLRR